MSAWNHLCCRLINAPAPSRAGTWKGRPYYRDVCSFPRCEKAQEYRTFYRYVTGKAGRVSSAYKDMCGQHAGKFCRKYRIDMSQIPEVDYREPRECARIFGELEASTYPANTI